MQKRIALMTWYTYHNYGTALQASALYHVVKQIGYDVDLINYSPKKNSSYTPNKVYSSIIKVLLNKIKEIVNKPVVSQRREELFFSFLSNHTTQTEPCRSFAELHDLNQKYDAFICGSDQIWSPLNFDDKYFLSFVDTPQKMVAYAPSMGTNKVDNEHLKEEITKLLTRFINLSVREKDGQKLIHRLTGKNAKVVLDPTLLLSKSDWDSFLTSDNENEIPQKDYIICYFLGNPKKYRKYVEKLSQKKGMPYIVIPVKKSQYKSMHKVPFEVGPAEFVSLIKHARYVCTDSFHGMAFSLIYNVPFTVFKRFSDRDPQNQNSRIINLLDTLRLNDRLIPSSGRHTFSEFEQDNFDQANQILKAVQNESKTFLFDVLEKATAEPLCQTSKEYRITDTCCGCGACASVCPKEAITIQKSQEGFQHYFINQEQCIHCGKCKTVCPMTNIKSKDLHDAHSLYSAKSNDEQASKASSSAGVGYALTQFGIKNKYYLCGCIYDSKTSTARHLILSPTESEKVRLFQGSKYIQSITSEVMKEIQTMDPKEKILFFGTPCQVAAVRKLTQAKSMQNVILIDLICHGVPSYHLWEKYLDSLDQTYATGKNPQVLFRSATTNWHERKIKVSGNGNTYSKSDRKDDFYAFFRRGICDMYSCSECPYREKSSADLRIGDFWGKKFQNSEKPTSMIIANTDVGDELLTHLKKENCIIEKQDLEDYWLVQAPYNLKRSLYREEIMSALRDKDQALHQLRKKYCKYHDLFEHLETIRAKLK